MSRDWDDPSSSPEERESLAQLAERLELERPVPGAGFRGELRRGLLSAESPTLTAARHRTWAISYVGAGLMCLAVAAAGLIGAGPFAA